MYNLLEKKKQEKIPIAQKLSEECGNSTFFNYYQNSSKNGDMNNKLKSKLDDFKLIAQGFAERYKIPLKASIWAGDLTMSSNYSVTKQKHKVYEV